jgi:uncharacterized membrane protein SpoIIM required for sporulation
MKQNDFEQQHQPLWDEFSKLLKGDDKTLDRKRLPDLYQVVSHHLAISKQRRYSTNLIHRLNHLVVEGHKRFYGDLPRFRANFFYQCYVGFPRAIRSNAPFVWAGLALFFIPGFIFFFLCLTSDELIYSLMSYDQVRDFERMYDPGSRALGRTRESDTDLKMFCFYIYNNIGISFQTFASGIFFGLGSLFFLIYNGIFIGAAAGHITQVGYTDTFFPFVVGHGAFELTAIAFSGAAGLKLGWALISPGPYKRLMALKLAAKDAVIMVYGTTAMLLLAAFIEAFWSSSSTLPISVKYTVGAGFWALTIIYILFSGRSRNAAE